jgi:hypothetical protein
MQGAARRESLSNHALPRLDQQTIAAALNDLLPSRSHCLFFRVEVRNTRPSFLDVPAAAAGARDLYRHIARSHAQPCLIDASRSTDLRVDASRLASAALSLAASAWTCAAPPSTVA